MVSCNDIGTLRDFTFYGMAYAAGDLQPPKHRATPERNVVVSQFRRQKQRHNQAQRSLQYRENAISEIEDQCAYIWPHRI